MTKIQKAQDFYKRHTKVIIIVVVILVIALVVGLSVGLTVGKSSSSSSGLSVIQAPTQPPPPPPRKYIDYDCEFYKCGHLFPTNGTLPGNLYYNCIDQCYVPTQAPTQVP